MTEKEMELLCDENMNACTREKLHDTLAPCDNNCLYNKEVDKEE